ncbi:MAG: tripartite tricarboxylate transporter permease [Deltaproteobacteria bacterium]|nr:tripartite tricarboxylate transporter permease [Deltaproteobacteria bacterium]MBW2305087.1 tripartite tricarboxylate transporter permease [Deltaproteobacteria bacterium]
MLENFATGLHIILTWQHILAIVVGSFLGLVVGSVPGLTATMAVALILPITFDMDFVTSIMLMVGAYKGGIFGGSITAILLNTPGTPASACTVLDGYTMTQQGKGVKALKMAKYASTLADLGSDIILIAVAAPLAAVALRFGPPEISMLIIFSLTVVAGVAGKSIIKGLISGAFGLLLATVGLDPVMTTRRLTFNVVDLDSGISLIPLLIGLFALSEVFLQLGKKSRTRADRFVIRHSSNPSDNRVSWAEFRGCVRTILRGTFIGTVIGIIPGIGTGIASFISYGQARRASKNPEKFGNGSLEGIAASESGNSAVVGATFIPLLTMGIPGDIITAVIMGAFMIQGLIPGPLLFKDHAHMIYAIFLGFIICDIVYFIIGSLFMKYAAYLSKVPRGYLFPVVLIFCVVGAYAINHSMFDVGTMVFFGILGFFMLKFGFATAPLLIAFILSPIGETAVRQSLLLSGGSLSIFVTRPIALVFLIMTVLSIIGIIRSQLKGRAASKFIKQEDAKCA